MKLRKAGLVKTIRDGCHVYQRLSNLEMQRHARGTVVLIRFEYGKGLLKLS